MFPTLFSSEKMDHLLYSKSSEARLCQHCSRQGCNVFIAPCGHHYHRLCLGDASHCFECNSRIEKAYHIVVRPAESIFGPSLILCCECYWVPEEEEEVMADENEGDQMSLINQDENEGDQMSLINQDENEGDQMSLINQYAEDLMSISMSIVKQDDNDELIFDKTGNIKLSNFEINEFSDDFCAGSDEEKEI